MKHALLLPGLQLLAVEEVGGGFLIAEEEPVLTRGTRCLALLKKGHERGDSRAGADHDCMDRRILGNAEMLGRMDENGNGSIIRAV